MSKLIKAIRIRTDRAELLREKAIELTIREKEHITETDLINFMIDAITERIEIDKNGLFIKDEDEEDNVIGKKNIEFKSMTRRKDDIEH
jgi:hypothetical protein